MQGQVSEWMIKMMMFASSSMNGGGGDAQERAEHARVCERWEEVRMVWCESIGLRGTGSEEGEWP